VRSVTFNEEENLLLTEIWTNVLEIKPDRRKDLIGYIIYPKSGKPTKVFLPPEQYMLPRQTVVLAMAKGHRLEIFRNTGFHLYSFGESDKVLEFKILINEKGNPVWDCDALEVEEVDECK
jgi:hypothetical protein